MSIETLTYEQRRKHYFEKLLDQRKRSLNYWLREDAYERIEEVSAEKAYIEDAINALEKQTPKRPIHMHKNYCCPVCKENGWVIWNDTVPYDFDNFCGRCGQALDWSENHCDGDECE